MDRIRLHLNGDVEIRTIRANEGLVLITISRKDNGEKWFTQTRKARSFKEIYLIESIKAVFFQYERDNGNNEDEDENGDRR